MSLWNAKTLAEQTLLPKPGIVGVSFSPNTKIRVYLEHPGVETPREIAGIRVERVVVGKIRALSLPPASVGYATGGLEVPKNARVRPLTGGISIGHVKITAGTLACFARDNTTGEPLILSNAHVLAPHWIGAKPGDPILQPGPYDGGRDPEDRVATLLRYVPIDPSKPNLVDAAVARPTSPEFVSPEVLDIGTLNAMEEAFEGMKVAKSGRTTCFSTAVVTDVNATVKVSYETFDAVFTDQIMTTKLGEPGDSGSIVVNVDTRRAVGLLFAGSDYVTVLNKIANVCSLLDISIGPPVVVPAPILTPILIGAGLAIAGGV